MSKCHSMTLQAINAVAVRDVPMSPSPLLYRKAFQPRDQFGEESPLTQPRVITEADLEYEPLQKAFSAARGLLIGLAIELAGFIVIGVYLWARGLY